MIEHRVLIDVTHMSASSIEDTVRLVGKDAPLLASHGAARFSRPGRPGYEYNLDKRHVRQIRDSDGVIGLIMCRHYISGRFKRPKDADVSFKHLCRHIDRIAKWCDGSFDHIGIGSDLDGFIKPALPGFTDMDNMADLQDRLEERYGAENAEKISSGNALRMLRYRFGAAVRAAAIRPALLHPADPGPRDRHEPVRPRDHAAARHHHGRLRPGLESSGLGYSEVTGKHVLAVESRSG